MSETPNELNIIEPNPALPDYQLKQLSANVIKAIDELGWADLLPVQKKSIPYILNANDLVVQSKTGSGKTAAFVLPFLEIIDANFKHPQTLVLAPTRELARQIKDNFDTLSKYTSIQAEAVYGGVDFDKQADKIKQGAQFIVGTPGRVLDHLKQKTFSFKYIRDLVLDEADEMLSMGFYEDMEKIRRALPEDRCSYMFSATFNPMVQSLAKDFLNKPKYLNLSPKNDTISAMDRSYYCVDAMDKDRFLNKIIEIEQPQSALIFCNTKKETHYIYEYLKSKQPSVGVISGDISQSAREKVLSKLKSNQLKFLVATDVAARGIDVDDLSHVIIYDHPKESEIYIHRSGRTARAGKKGISISLVTQMEEIELQKTQLKYNINIVKKELAYD